MTNLADTPLRAAQVAAAIPDLTERISTAASLVPQLAVPEGVLLFLTELLHNAGKETLAPVMEHALSTMAVTDLADLLRAGNFAPDDASWWDMDDWDPDENELGDEVDTALHDLVCTKLPAPAFVALVHLLTANGRPMLVRPLLTLVAGRPIPELLAVLTAMHTLVAPCLEDVVSEHNPAFIADLAAALRAEERDSDAHTLLYAAGRRLAEEELAELSDRLQALGRIQDVRALAEGVAKRH